MKKNTKKLLCLRVNDTRKHEGAKNRDTILLHSASHETKPQLVHDNGHSPAVPTCLYRLSSAAAIYEARSVVTCRRVSTIPNSLVTRKKLTLPLAFLEQ
ncbi:hypothetical protein A3J23_00655 [Candidatus Peregrinibacteria bacterium RIFCSPLOWO2_02_FULL_48_14]|nr:MAG: hypothetical protein A3J23_00655 [Candidatus Peregrinibacteria bacterium RIFCSPLOWO2_02_FULL_48_14]